MTKSIKIKAKQFHDEENGTTYFSGVITVNDTEDFFLKYQYGYGDHYEFESKLLLTEFNKISSDHRQSLKRYCWVNDIMFESSIKSGCPRKEVRAIEDTYNNNLK